MPYNFFEPSGFCHFLNLTFYFQASELMFWGLDWNVSFSYKNFWCLGGASVWERNYAGHSNITWWCSERTSHIPSDSIHFLKLCFLDKVWGWIYLFWSVKQYLPPSVPPSFSFRPLWVLAFSVHTGRVPCFHQRQAIWGLVLEQTGRVSTLLWKKYCQSVGLAHYHKTSFNHCNCSLLYILPEFCATLQPLSCPPNSFVYISFSLDFKLFEDRDLFLVVILSPTGLVGAQSMPGDLNGQWMKKGLLRGFSSLIRQRVHSKGLFEPCSSSVMPAFVKLPFVARK